MLRGLFSLIFAVSAAFGQYKIDSAGGPPAELAPGISSALQQPGVKVMGGDGAVFCEVWFRNSAPGGGKSAEEGVSLPTIPHGALMGAIRFPAQGSDRRGQTIKPGVYTLRYSQHPVNGDHLGVAPQRDFLVMTPAAEDQDASATPDFDTLMAMSRKASGTPHPAVLSVTSGTAGAAPSLAKEGDHDWVLSVKVGEMPVALTIVGKVEG